MRHKNFGPAVHHTPDRADSLAYGRALECGDNNLSLPPKQEHQALAIAAPFPVERLRELLHYDPETGVWTWRVNRGRFYKKGQPAGTICLAGYRRITIDGRMHKASRLAFYYMTGFFLPRSIHMDHKNGVRDDDRWQNLRPATPRQNAQNKALTCRNKSGRVGVCRSDRPGKWVAHITIAMRTLRLGHFEDITDAIDAREAAEREHFGEFARAAA